MVNFPHRLPDAHAVQQPAIGDGIRPNCEAYGYLLDASGNCSHHRLQPRSGGPPRRPAGVGDGQTCLYTRCATSELWTCGHLTWLKDTTRRDEDGGYRLLTAEHVFRDYQFSRDNRIALPGKGRAPVRPFSPGRGRAGWLAARCGVVARLVAARAGGRVGADRRRIAP